MPDDTERRNRSEKTPFVPAPVSLSDGDFNRFRRLVYEHSHISLGDNKRELVRTRLGKVMRKLGIRSFGEYYDYVTEDESGRAVVDMVNAISTNLTSFFRENQHFEFLSKVAVPELAEAHRMARNYRIRAWSAGCSSGEEPYTMGIVLLEHLPETIGWDLKILATDIDTNMLEHAARGVYEERKVETISKHVLHKYFQRGEGGRKDLYRVKPLLQKIVAFRRLNLVGAYPFRGPFDLVFCRNVMIYFDRPTQQDIIARFYDLLAPGGYLFVGHSESLTGVQHRFTYVQPTVYRK